MSVIYTYGHGITVDEEGYSNGKHWEMITDTDKYGTGKPGNGRGLRVDGVIVISCQNYAMHSVTIGETVYFEVKRYESDKHRKLYNLSGERVFSFEFDLIKKGGADGNLNGLYEFAKIDNGVHRHYLCDSNLKLIKSEYDGYARRIDIEGYNGYLITVPSGTSGTCDLYDSNLKLLKSGILIAEEEKLEGRNEKYIRLSYKKGDSYEYELYTRDWKLALPRYKYLWQNKDNQGNFKYWYIEDSYGYKGRLDSNWNWILPLEKRFSEIYDTKIAGINYYRCKKGGYWGLFDSKFNEVIAPDYEELGIFDGTNFIKFKLNGFWGVMTLQGRTTRTIIPTTRGYTNISRYVKSQKRFLYEMNGYKGECNHLGQQISKIKTGEPTAQSVSQGNKSNTQTVAKSSVSSSSSTSSSTSDDNDTRIISFDYYTSPNGTKIKGKYTFSIQFKSDAVYFKLTNEKGRSTANTIYNFKLKELFFSEAKNKLMIGFNAGNKRHAFVFKKGYYDPVEHRETNLTTRKETVTLYSQETKDAAVTAGLSMLLGSTPTELFYDRLFEDLCLYMGNCKIKLIDESN